MSDQTGKSTTKMLRCPTIILCSVYVCIIIYNDHVKLDTLLIMFIYIYSHGLSRSGTEYGPLTDLPDWSFAGKLIAYYCSSMPLLTQTGELLLCQRARRKDREGN